MNSLAGKKDISDSLSDYFNQPFASSWANDIRSAALVAYKRFGAPSKRDE